MESLFYIQSRRSRIDIDRDSPTPALVALQSEFCTGHDGTCTPDASGKIVVCAGHEYDNPGRDETSIAVRTSEKASRYRWILEDQRTPRDDPRSHHRRSLQLPNDLTMTFADDAHTRPQTISESKTWFSCTNARCGGTKPRHKHAVCIQMACPRVPSRIESWEKGADRWDSCAAKGRRFLRTTETSARLQLLFEPCRERDDVDGDA